MPTADSISETLPISQTGGVRADPVERPISEQAKLIVVVGNGMVGHRFCQSLAKADPTGQYCIMVMGEEPRPAYDRVHLSESFIDENPDRLTLSSRSWYQSQSIDLHTGDPVMEIDRDRKRVKTQSGRSIGYDHLVLATGSSPFIPPIEGVDQSGVYLYRTVEDVIKIRKAAQSARTAAVIGGGLLGLEAAQALKHLGIETSVIEFANGLMPRQLNMSSGQVLREKIEENGVSVLLRAHTRSIVATDRGLEILFENRPSIVVDFVVVSVGIRPRDELAESAGLKVAGSRGGVVINDKLETSDPDIYAIGECALHRGKVYGLVAPGYEMADILVKRLMGNNKAVFTEGDLSTRLKLVGVTVGVFGLFDADCRSVSFARPGLRRSLLISSNRVVGATIVGDWSQISQVQELVDREGAVSTRMLNRFRETGDLFSGSVALPVQQWPASRLVCNCMKVTRGDLSAAILSGCTDAQALMEKTCAGTACGSCKPLLAQLTGSPVDEASAGRTGWRVMMFISLLAIVGLAVGLFAGPVPLADEFTSPWYRVDRIWRVGWIKQTTGFVLLGLSALGLVLSLRKRIKWLGRLGGYSWYRLFHAAIGVLCLAGLVVHTGMHMGRNLNFYLMCVFLGLTAAGALAGAITAIEARGQGAWAVRARRLRPILTWIHIILFWPLPVLVGFHIAAAYMY